VGLGGNPGREMVFGAVGKAWQPSIEWRRVEPGDFAEVGEPGWAKMAAALVVRPYGIERSLPTYEARCLLRPGFRQALRPLMDARVGGGRDSHARCATGGQDSHGTGGRVLTRQGIKGRE
jgi:hypothetical protein